MVCRGGLYALIGVLGLQIAVGAGRREADEAGAITAIAGQPFGVGVLAVMLAGFAALLLWQLTEAVAGSGELAERLEAAVRAVFYCFLVMILGNLLFTGEGPGSGDRHSKDLTAAALHLPGGRILVGIVGLGVVSLGLYWVYRGVSRRFFEDLHRFTLSPQAQRLVAVVGITGHLARGLVAGLAGVFVIEAAVRYTPEHAKGVDATLRAFADTRFGSWLLVAVAAGLMCFAAYCVCEARWRRV